MKIQPPSFEDWMTIRTQQQLIQAQGIACEIFESNSEIGLPWKSFVQVYPQTRAEVRLLLELARHHDWSLYPISRGQNLGYGYNFPCRPTQIVMNLRNFAEISEYDPEIGEVRIEAGVSQEQLYLFLQDKPFLMDSTGAGPEASVLGNALDGGIGYSPYGAKRYAIFDLEILLADGEIMHTGHLFELGPSVSQLFVQGNLGIVLSAKIRLFPKPERILGLIIRVKQQQQLGQVLQRLKFLKTSGEIKNIIHFANPMRLFMSSVSLHTPETSHLLEKEIITEADIFQKRQYYWIGIGAIMGDRDLIPVYRRKIRQQLRGLAQVISLDTRTIIMAKRFLGPFLPSLTRKLEGMEELMKLQSGFPTAKPWQNIRWRYQTMEETGIIWVGLLLPNKPQVINDIVIKLQKLFTEANFEMPLTLSLFEPQSLVGIITILYRRGDAELRERAHKLYSQVLYLAKTEGIRLYRKAILPHEYGIGVDKLEFLRTIKAIVDPQGVIAPGKYDI